MAVFAALLPTSCQSPPGINIIHMPVGIKEKLILALAISQLQHALYLNKLWPDIIFGYLLLNCY